MTAEEPQPADEAADAAGAAGESGEADEAARPAKVPTMRGAQSALLTFEAIVVWLGIIAAVALTDVSAVVAISVGVILALICVTAAGMLRRPYGLVVGSAVQVLVLASGIFVRAMLVLGVIFAGLWILAIVLDRKMAADRAARTPTP